MTFTRVALAGALALSFAGAAHAQAIPTPANPTPNFPVTTDGSPLPSYRNAAPGGLLTGRSVFAPVGAGVGFAETAVGTVVDGTVGRVAR